jgi:hypothetical protein
LGFSSRRFGLIGARVSELSSRGQVDHSVRVGASEKATPGNEMAPTTGDVIGAVDEVRLLCTGARTDLILPAKVLMAD